MHDAVQQRSIYELLRDTAADYPDGVAYQSKRGGTWQDLTWAETRSRVKSVSKALIALGAAKNDRVSILAQSREEWALCDFGINCCGCVTVGIYPSNLGPDCAYILNHSDSEILFVEDRDQLDKILAVRDDLPRLRHIVIYEGSTDAENNVLSWDDFLHGGEGVPDEQMAKRGEEVAPEDMASLVYTSGTTGTPKGVILTHRNLLFTSWTANQCLYIERQFIMLLFLPLAHVFARAMIYCCLRHGATIAFAEDITKVADNLREVRPHWIPSVPRIYEKVYDKIISNAEAAGGVKRRLFYWAVGVGRQVSKLQQQKRPLPALLRLRHALANKLVLHKIQAAFGGRLLFAISGAAPLNVAIQEFFHACGVLILEGIGMTENSSFSNVNRFDDYKFGTVGPPGPLVEMKTAEDGEVLYRGDNVMQGYFKNPEATAEAIDSDGWLHTGDVGEIDEDNHLRITDRKKDLIVTAGGKNVAPQRIERILCGSRFVAQAMAYGDRRRYITALVTLDAEKIEAWAGRNGLGDLDAAALAAHPSVQQLIDAELERLNRDLASFETVKKVHIVPREFTLEAGELTPTQKLKRKVVAERYRRELDALY